MPSDIKDELVEEMVRLLDKWQTGVAKKRRDLAHQLVKLSWRWADAQPEKRADVLADGKQRILAWYRGEAQRRPSRSMTKDAVAARIALKANTSKRKVYGVMAALAKLAAREAGNVFVLPGFGRLILTNRMARLGRNPQTGEPIKIPSRRVLKFRLAQSLKDAVLGGSSDPPARKKSAKVRRSARRAAKRATRDRVAR